MILSKRFSKPLKDKVVKGVCVTIPRDEKLKITQRVHAKWSEIYDDRDDVEANDAYFKMYEEAMAEAEEKYKDRPANS